MLNTDCKYNDNRYHIPLSQSLKFNVRLLLEHLEKGNQHYRAGNLSSAKKHYMVAGSQSAEMVKSAPENNRVIEVFLTAHQNIADVYIEENLLHIAEMKLREAYRTLHDTYDACANTSPEEVNEIQHGVERSYRLMVAHIEKYGSSLKTPLPPVFNRSIDISMNL